MRQTILKNNSKGSALVMVIIVLVVISMMVVGVSVITQSNTFQVAAQEKGMQSYYIARSGAEVAYQILMTSSPSLLTGFQTNVSHTIPQSSIDLGEGSADVSVAAFDQGAPAVRRIRITSIGEAAGTGIERTAILEFDLNGGANISWSR